LQQQDFLVRQQDMVCADDRGSNSCIKGNTKTATIAHTAKKRGKSRIRRCRERTIAAASISAAGKNWVSSAERIYMPTASEDQDSIRQREYRATFRELHEKGCFVIPNPWDAGSARYLQHLGFPALATTSSGAAFSLGRPDEDRSVPRDVMLAHIAEIAGAAGVPVNADFKSGYARDPAALAANVRRCIKTGVAGLSIEDSTEDPEAPLFEFTLAVKRIRAAREAIDKSRTGVLLTARAECYLVGTPEPLAEAIRRLQAYSEAGADVLYAPGPRTKEEIRAIVEAVHPKPVNALMIAGTGLKVSDFAEIGVRRISVGSALARCAWGGFLRAAREIATQGTFDAFKDAPAATELNEFFRKDANSDIL
jgi:2-methylisocitrate lyase-like PEP mutase family enzyme